MWYWEVFYTDTETLGPNRSNIARSATGFEFEISARQNLEARLNSNPPCIPGIPPKACIFDFQVVYKSRREM